jgi:hypothetical protein
MHDPITPLKTVFASFEPVGAATLTRSMAKDFVLGHGSTSPIEGEVMRGRVDACIPEFPPRRRRRLATTETVSLLDRRAERRSAGVT